MLLSRYEGRADLGHQHARPLGAWLALSFCLFSDFNSSAARRKCQRKFNTIKLVVIFVVVDIFWSPYPGS